MSEPSSSAGRKPLFRVPGWAADAVWYQIFPERFRRGTAASDPQLPDITERMVPGWQLVPWGMDWYGRADWEQGQDFWKTVYLRRYGGDLVGVRRKLGYLRDLGVNALYLNPVFDSPSLHKYDASCLHHVDPTLGPDRAGDLRQIAQAQETEDPATWVWTKADLLLRYLIADAHALGMRVILDGVFNHAGCRFFAFKDLQAKGRASRYKNWFKVTWKPDGTFDYDGWFGHKSLPEFARTEKDLAAPVRRYLFDITRRWMDPDGDGDPRDGVDGWRLDVAYCVPHGFWQGWRRHVKRINPEAYLTAEIVGPAGDWLRGDEFDAVMNYMWLYPTVSFFAPFVKGYGARRFQRDQDRWLKAYPEECLHAQQNLLDSHDVGRVASMMQNLREPMPDFDRYFHLSRVQDQPAFDTRKPLPAVWRALKQALVFQATFLGAPMLYYGTEAGLWGANDPCDRQPMLWPDLAYEPERATPKGGCSPRTRAFDAELHAFVRRVLALRHAHAALRHGRLRWLATRDDRLLGYVREDDAQRIAVLLNASDAPVVHTLRCAGTDLWTGRFIRDHRLKVAARNWRIVTL